MKVGDGIGSDHLIDTHLSRLRIKIRDYGGGNYIYAVRGIGIRLSNPNVQNNQLRSHQNA
jgi:DNA-binding response OmpR family regulator